MANVIRLHIEFGTRAWRSFNLAGNTTWGNTFQPVHHKTCVTHTARHFRDEKIMCINELGKLFPFYFSWACSEIFVKIVYTCNTLSGPSKDSQLGLNRTEGLFELLTLPLGRIHCKMPSWFKIEKMSLKTTVNGRKYVLRTLSIDSFNVPARLYFQG